MPLIQTIGYEKAGFDDFVRTLKEAQVSQILDIRDLPLSRRAGFSKRQLAVGLQEAGIAYVHLKGLGTPKEGRIAAKAGKMEIFHEIFSAHMKTQQAKDELQNASNLIVKNNSCLLCFEADEKRCHRLIVAKAIHKLTGLSVQHLHVSVF